MLDRFAPLTEAERDAVPLAEAPEIDGGEIVSPIPSDASPAPSIHYRYGEPSAVWTYRDGRGETLMHVARFDPPGERKQFVPITLWREPSGEFRWRWKGVPAPRPLYRLDLLAAEPDAPVVVVEGEKAADAAAMVFPKSVCVTSPGGSQAAAKADWKPLSGRRVLIWPDADEPGSKYAADVARALSELGCEVSIVDSMTLAGMSPDGGARDPVKGWDAADAVQEWSDLPALRKSAAALAKSFEPGPQFISWGAFTMDTQGLRVEVTKGRGEAAETINEWVCASFEVLGATRDPHGRDWGKWLRWRDGDGRAHVRHVSESSLQGDASSLCASLAAEGLQKIDRSKQRALASYLCGVETKGRVTLVARTGWHNVGGRDVFVLPNETIGPRGAESVILDASAVGPYESRGSLSDWQTGVGALVADHALGVLAVSTALAGPLLYLARQEGGGVHFVGNSSQGKSTLQQAAASVWGRGGAPGFVKSWRATANGLEGAAASSCDTLLALDEMGMIEPREMAAAVYGLANGAGKQRAARDGSLREPKSWRVMVVSSGELTIAQKIGEDRGKRAKAGQEVRLLDIRSDRGLGFGAFDSGGRDGDAGKLATAIKQAAQSHYGAPGPEFVRRLIAERVDGETVRELVADFVAAEVPAGSDGQIDRAAQRLGLIGMAGELAAALGVTPWPAGAARDAAAWALARWIEARGGTEPAEVRQAIEAVRLTIEQHGESRFEPIDCDTSWRPMGSRLGWRTGDGAEREWLIPSEIWKSEVCFGLDPKFVAKALGERGLIQRAGDGWQVVRRIGGRSTRVFVVLPSILEGANHVD